MIQRSCKLQNLPIGMPDSNFQNLTFRGLLGKKDFVALSNLVQQYVAVDYIFREWDFTRSPF